MRLHHLEATAFGPFAGTVRVDFDALSEAGLFLLTGPTGSGKSSVLDAVCFALYGEVPGDRGTARQLRSDRAEAGVAPRVVLDCTLSGRRLRISRSPAWSRPKKRGSGTTPQQASVVLEERVRGSWQPVSTRLDEGGQLLGTLLGMTLGQFTQVAMLPQGRFQAFLRARADERQKVLEQLFRTRRFRDVEEWLAERRRVLGRRSREQQHQVEVLLSRIAETCGEDPPDDWYDDGLAAAVDEGELLAWVSGRVARADAGHEQSRAASAEARAGLRDAAASLRAAEALADRQDRLAAALREREALAADEEDQRRGRERLAAAARALPVLTLLDVAREADARSTACRERAEGATAAARDLAAPLLGGPAGDLDKSLGSWLREAARRAGDARALLPEERRLETLAADLVRLRRRREQVRVDLEEADRRRQELPRRVEESRAAESEARVAAAAVPGLRASVARLEERLAAARQVEPLTSRLEEATTLAAAAVDDLQRRREDWLEVKEKRLAGMAAEIAGALAVGADCPVCGSVEHPHPARAAEGAPDAATEKRARARVDDAELARLAADERVRDLTTQLALVRQSAGEDPPDRLDRALADHRAKLATAEATAGDAAARSRNRVSLESELASAARDEEELRARRDALDVEIAAAGERAEGIRTRVTALLQESGLGPGATLAELAGTLERVVAACEDARTARADSARRLADREQADVRAAEAVRAAGFDDASRVRSAALPEPERLRLERRLGEHDRRAAVVAATLEDRDLIAAAAEAPPDLAAVRTAEEEARDTHARAEHRVRTLDRERTRLLELGTAVQEALAVWAPLRRELVLTSELAAFAEGKSPDNRLQMRLSAYVLGFRLGQVVDAANERLAVMSGERYALEHTGGRGAGDRRGGLGLRVRDAWSGLARDPATLSGGETFVVSLALALGLADVIAQEAAGARLDTLFVDEGFGALDPETLEDVLDVLDQLREGGRVVGVVSHVAEMADRIPARLVVRSSREGSTLRLAGVG